jgi:hypothetical protein
MNQACSISKDWKSNESGTLNIKRLEVQWIRHAQYQKIGSPMNQARSISKDWKPNESGTLNIKRLEAQWTMNLLERKTAQRHYFITLSTDDLWRFLPSIDSYCPYIQVGHSCASIHTYLNFKDDKINM